MKLFLNNAIKKYKYMPIEMKAAAWYAIGNIIQKICAMVSNDNINSLFDC